MTSKIVSNLHFQIFEGEGRYYKVRNLTENTKYRFRIRCKTRLSGMGEWSEPYEFTTLQLPPPPIRTPPTINEVASGSFQIEWQPIRNSSSLSTSSDSVFYRLQTAPRTANGPMWKTVHTWQNLSAFGHSISTQFHIMCICEYLLL